MSYFYLDSSALTKRYLPEKGTTWVRALTDPATGHTVAIAQITRVEVAAALASRHRVPNGLTLVERDNAVGLLLQHCDTEYYIVAWEATTISRAVTLTQNYRLRGYDAVQLATALVMNEALLAAGLHGLTLLSADDDLNAAAQAEGLATENPNDHR